jgi:hypothetical protein
MDPAADTLASIPDSAKIDDLYASTLGLDDRVLLG